MSALGWTATVEKAQGNKASSEDGSSAACRCRLAGESILYPVDDRDLGFDLCGYVITRERHEIRRDAESAPGGDARGQVVASDPPVDHRAVRKVGKWGGRLVERSYFYARNGSPGPAV